MHPSKCAYPARVTMLDAQTLDHEVFNILRSQLQTVFRIVPPWILTKHEQNMELILHYVIWKLSINKFHGTFGQQLLNMKYKNHEMTDTKQYLLLMTQILGYLHSNSFFSFSPPKVNEAVRKVDIFLHTCNLINLLWFFADGKYPTLINRVLSLRPVLIVNKPRSIGYNYMTRELLWHGFIELLTFTLSVVNYQFIRRKFNQLFAKSKKTNQKSILKYTIRTKCSVCGQNPILPNYFGCSHVACFYCLKANKLIDTNFECPDCGYFQEDNYFVKVS